MTDDNQPHSSALRRGRVSAAQWYYFVTVNVDSRRPLLTPPAREIIIGSINWARANQRIQLAGYVIMDDHFHFLFVLSEHVTLMSFMQTTKSFCSREINRLLSMRGQLWQEGYHDHAIRDEPDFWHHLNYLHANPVRRGLVDKPEDYLWSTAHPSRSEDVDWDVML